MLGKQIIFLACVAARFVLSEDKIDPDDGCNEKTPYRTAEGLCKEKYEDSQMVIPNFCHDSGKNYQCFNNMCASSYADCKSLSGRDIKERTTCDKERYSLGY